MALRDRQPFPGSTPQTPYPEQAPVAAPPTVVSYGIVAFSVAGFVLDLLFPGAVALPSGEVVAVHQGMLLGPLVRQGEWWRVFSTLFTHGNALHLLFNMSAVWTLGRVLEGAIGSYRFLITSIVGALGAATLVLIFNYQVPTVGASGMILSWAGAMIPIATRQGRRSLGVWLVQVLVISLLPGVSWAGHLGGFLFGIPCGLVMRRPGSVFITAAPVLVFVAAVLVVLAGTGRLGVVGP